MPSSFVYGPAWPPFIVGAPTLFSAASSSVKERPICCCFFGRLVQKVCYNFINTLFGKSKKNLKVIGNMFLEFGNLSNRGSITVG